MSDTRAERDATQPPEKRDDEPVQYPENRVLAVVDTVEQVRVAVDVLTSSGFLESEVELLHGASAAEKLRESTGRSGLRDLAMRVVASIGMPDDETGMKNRYAEALREGRFLVTVLAPTEERKKLAGRLLEEHGGHFINFLGRFTIERLVRPIGS